LRQRSRCAQVLARNVLHGDEVAVADLPEVEDLRDFCSRRQLTVILRLVDDIVMNSSSSALFREMRLMATTLEALPPNVFARQTSAMRRC
jgi:hypothetical protein